MRKQKGHRHISLAGLAELRPVFRHRRIEIEKAALDEHMRTRCDRTLAARHHHRDGLIRIRTILDPVAPAPEIDDFLAVAIDAKLRAAFVRLLAFGKALAHPLEALFHAAGDVDHWNAPP